MFSSTFLFLVYFPLNHFARGEGDSDGWSSDGSIFPNPQFDQQTCHRNPNISSSVCDVDNILKLNDSDHIQAVIDEIFHIRDDCSYGYEVGVAVVEKLNLSGMSADDAIEKFARSVHDSWGVGGRECNSGVLFALSTVDRVFFFSTGDGTKDIITQNRIDSMTKMTKYFAEGNFGDGTIQATLDIQSFILDGPDPGGSPFTILVIAIFPALICIVFCVCALHSRKQSNKRRDFLAHKRRIIEEFRKKNTSNDTCPVCLEGFSTEHVESVSHGCGHYYHERCMEGQQTCPICSKMKLLSSSLEDQETKVKFQYLSKKYPIDFPVNNVDIYSSHNFLRGRRCDPQSGGDKICCDGYVPPSSSHGGGGGGGGGGFGGGCSSGGGGGHF